MGTGRTARLLNGDCTHRTSPGTHTWRDEPINGRLFIPQTYGLPEKGSINPSTSVQVYALWRNMNTFKRAQADPPGVPPVYAAAALYINIASSVPALHRPYGTIDSLPMARHLLSAET